MLTAFKGLDSQRTDSSCWYAGNSWLYFYFLLLAEKVPQSLTLCTWWVFLFFVFQMADPSAFYAQVQYIYRLCHCHANGMERLPERDLPPTHTWARTHNECRICSDDDESHGGGHCHLKHPFARLLVDWSKQEVVLTSSFTVMKSVTCCLAVGHSVWTCRQRAPSASSAASVTSAWPCHRGWRLFLTNMVNSHVQVTKYEDLL